MKLPSTPAEKNTQRIVTLVLQMTLAAVLFFIFCALSVDGKPAVDEDPVCGYEACPATSFDTLNVHLVPHSHDDVGWLKTPDQYYFEDVQNVISSVIDALKQNRQRKFVQVETAFFKKWWQRQKDPIKQAVQNLVNNGQLEFINAAWSMNDEAAVHYQSTIDQFTLGLRYIQDNLGECARPKVGWQIDPFGHSREQASISAQLGFDSMFFARLDYRDKNRRLRDKAMDLVWRGSTNLGNSSDIFTSVLYQHYSAPSGFCFDIVCNDEVLIDDEEDPDYNLERRVGEFANFVRGQAAHYPTNNILVTMGDDFRYEAAMRTYLNLDLLISGFEKFGQTYDDKPIKVFYSTPTCYTKAVNDYVNTNNLTLELKTDDFFPYADSPKTYWTGYFTSRPASKRFERQGNNLLQVAKQLAANTQESYTNEKINTLKEAVGVMQHHDAITGTEKQHVAKNYHFLLSRGMKDANDAAGEIISNLISGGDEDFEFDSCLLANVSSCSQTDSDEFTVAVYNPLSRTVSTTLNLPIYDRIYWEILDPEGNIVPYQIEGNIRNFSYVENANISNTILQFPARDLPPMGFKVYRFKDSSEAKPHVVEYDQEPRELIGYDDTNFEIDDSTGLLQAVTMNGVRVELTQDFQYYTSDNTSGAYIFVPLTPEVTRVASDKISVSLFGGSVSKTLVQHFGTWATQYIKVYEDVKNYIEFEWVIGPIDYGEGYGQEIISKFTSSLHTNGIFYTDSNGREILKRVRDSRADYNYTDEEPISGNYYPINTKIAIRDEDQDVELAILTDRSQGGSSLNDGEIEIMIHRACHHDDGRGVGESLNEQEFGQGIVVRGKHYLVVGPSSGDGQKSLRAIERDIAQRTTLAPWTFITKKDLTDSLNILQFSGLKRDLPDNVNILTLEPWDDRTLLLRLEHVLEQGEDENLSQEVTVDVSELFTLFAITELQETTLGANVPLEDNVRLHWPGSEVNEEINKRDVDDLKITLQPMQIRTFLAKVTYT